MTDLLFNKTFSTSYCGSYMHYGSVSLPLKPHIFSLLILIFTLYSPVIIVYTVYVIRFAKGVLYMQSFKTHFSLPPVSYINAPTAHVFNTGED